MTKDTHLDKVANDYKMGKDFFLTNYTSDKGLIASIHRELERLDIKKANYPIKNWGTDLNREFSTEKPHMAEKHLKEYSTSLAIREM